MIRRGKAEGWLHIPSGALKWWAESDEVVFDSTAPGFIADRGGALLATKSVEEHTGPPRTLLTVPQDLVLSLDRVYEYAKSDRDLREVLACLQNFGRVNVAVMVLYHSASPADRPADVTRCHSRLLADANFSFLPPLG